MDPLQNSEIIADRYSKLHKFYETTVRIRSKNRFTAHGMYDYLDEEGSTWPIEFQRFVPILRA